MTERNGNNDQESTEEVTEAPFDEERPQNRMPGETARALDYLLMYLNTDNRNINHFATKKQAIRDEDGRYNDQRKINATASTIVMWSRKYLWDERAEIFDNIKNSESEEIAKAVRERNFQYFFENDLKMALKVQSILMSDVERVEDMANENISQLLDRSQVIGKNMKTYVDVRQILKEMFVDHVNRERERSAKEQEEAHKAAEAEKALELQNQAPQNNV